MQRVDTRSAAQQQEDVMAAHKARQAQQYQPYSSTFSALEPENALLAKQQMELQQQQLHKMEPFRGVPLSTASSTANSPASSAGPSSPAYSTMSSAANSVAATPAGGSSPRAGGAARNLRHGSMITTRPSGGPLQSGGVSGLNMGAGNNAARRRHSMGEVEERYQQSSVQQAEPLSMPRFHADIAEGTEESAPVDAQHPYYTPQGATHRRMSTPAALPPVHPASGFKASHVIQIDDNTSSSSFERPDFNSSCGAADPREAIGNPAQLPHDHPMAARLRAWSEEQQRLMADAEARDDAERAQLVQ